MGQTVRISGSDFKDDRWRKRFPRPAKTLVILMKIAQSMVLNGLGKQVSFLIDDINAELDESHRTMLARKLQELRCQVFITSIEHPDPESLWQGSQTPDYRMFHVEHGKLKEE